MVWAAKPPNGGAEDHAQSRRNIERGTRGVLGTICHPRSPGWTICKLARPEGFDPPTQIRSRTHCDAEIHALIDVTKPETPPPLRRRPLADRAALASDNGFTA